MTDRISTWFGPMENGNYHEVTVLATYTLQLIGPSVSVVENWALAKAMLGGHTGRLREAEENLSDLLPPGYRVEIKEWSDE